MSLLENYRLGACEIAYSVGTLTGAAYAKRHFKKAQRWIYRSNGLATSCLALLSAFPA